MGLRYSAVETALLAGLLLLSALSLPDSAGTGGQSTASWFDQLARFLPEQVFTEVLPAVLLCVGLYWVLNLLGLGHASFWLMALLVILLQSMAALAHNQIEWHQFVGFELGVRDDRSVLRDTGLFLVSLVGLVALNRVIGLRQLDRRMMRQGIDRVERNRTSVFELLLLVGLVAVAMLLASLMMTLSALLGRFDGLLEGSSWTVVTIGGGATLLLALSLVFWYRGRRS